MPADDLTASIDSPIAPAQRCFAIQPDDSAELPFLTKALYIGSGGDIAVRPARGDADVTFRNLPAGYILDIRVRAVRSTGTSAGDLVGMA